MKRKLEDLAAKMAFDELDGAKAEKLRQAASSDADVERARQEYAALRADLQRLAAGTPEPTISTERLRDAILSSGLGRRSEPTRSWSWVWAPVATGVLAFAIVSSRHHAAPAGTNVELGSPPTVEQLPPIGSLPVAVNRDKNPIVSHTKMVAAFHHRAQSRPAEYAVHFARWLPFLNPQFVGETAKAEEMKSLADRLSSGAGTTGSATKVALKDSKGESKPAAAAQPIVLIQPDTDGQTGAQRATEVDSVANVLIGG